MIIRKYQKKDRQEVENIHFETGFLGKSMDTLLSRRQEWKKNIKYYLDNEPESAFVVEQDKKVVGYLLGCLDDSRNNETKEVIITMLINNLKAFFLPRKDRLFWRSQLKALYLAAIKKSGDRDFKTPKSAGHMHINFINDYRGKGAGTKLLKAFLAYAKSKSVKKIHADSFQTDLNPNNNFWRKNGFYEYSSVITQFWKSQYPNKKIRLVCYVKEI